MTFPIILGQIVITSSITDGWYIVTDRITSFITDDGWFQVTDGIFTSVTDGMFIVSVSITSIADGWFEITERVTPSITDGCYIVAWHQIRHS